MRSIAGAGWRRGHARGRQPIRLRTVAKKAGSLAGGRWRARLERRGVKCCRTGKALEGQAGAQHGRQGQQYEARQQSALALQVEHPAGVAAFVVRGKHGFQPALVRRGMVARRVFSVTVVLSAMGLLRRRGCSDVTMRRMGQGMHQAQHLREKQRGHNQDQQSCWPTPDQPCPSAYPFATFFIAGSACYIRAAGLFSINETHQPLPGAATPASGDADAVADRKRGWEGGSMVEIKNAGAIYRNKVALDSQLASATQLQLYAAINGRNTLFSS